MAKVTLRDTLEGISRESLKRLLRLAKIKRARLDVYNELRTCIKNKLDDILGDVVTILEYKGKRTVTYSDLNSILKTKGLETAVGTMRDTQDIFKIYRCGTYKSYTKDSITKQQKREEIKKQKLESGEKPRKPHPGTVAKREINFYTKRANCLYMAQLPFRRIVLEVLQGITEERPKFAAGILNLLQLVIERCLVKILMKADKISAAEDRVTLFAKDIVLAYELMYE